MTETICFRIGGCRCCILLVLFCIACCLCCLCVFLFLFVFSFFSYFVLFVFSIYFFFFFLIWSAKWCCARRIDQRNGAAQTPKSLIKTPRLDHGNQKQKHIDQQMGAAHSFFRWSICRCFWFPWSKRRVLIRDSGLRTAPIRWSNCAWRGRAPVINSPRLDQGGFWSVAVFAFKLFAQPQNNYFLYYRTTGFHLY